MLKMPFQKERIIKTDCSKIAEKLKIRYGSYIEICDLKTEADICISKSGENECCVTIGESVTYTAYPIGRVEAFLFENPTYEKSIFALHGAAVEWKGKAYVFLAATTTGKTTLTSYLTFCGCGYITEDCVLLDRQSFDIYPVLVPIRLREGGLNVLMKYHALPAGVQKVCEGDEPCRYTYMPENCVEGAIPLGEIFFIERTEDENLVLPMTTTEKMAALIKSPLMVYPISPEYLQFLGSVAVKCCKGLRYKDMDFVKEVIEQHALESFI